MYDVQDYLLAAAQVLGQVLATGAALYCGYRLVQLADDERRNPRP